MLIGTIIDMMGKGLLGLLRRTLIDLQVKCISIIVEKAEAGQVKDTGLAIIPAAAFKRIYLARLLGRCE